MRPATRLAVLLAGCAVVFPGFAFAQSLSGEPAQQPYGAPLSVDPVATQPGGLAVTDQALAGQEADLVDAPGAEAAIPDDFGRMNLREGTVDGLRTRYDNNRDDASGVRIGTFILKPTLGQSFNHEINKDSGEDDRSYLETGLKGTLTSDWSRHQLTVTGEGIWQKNVSGDAETEPLADVEAELRLDFSEETIGRLRAGYHFEREDSTDPNAIEAATTQSGINQYTLGAGIEHNFGLLRGSARVDFDRYQYGDAEFDSGTTISMDDRNRNAGTVTGRIGYEISPAIIPFLEAAAGKSIYDEQFDRFGYERSSDTYAGRAGVQVDFGEKVNGEIALGYETYRFDDDRLNDLDGFTVDGTLNWSPLRGTNIAYGLSTGIEPSTTAGENGALVYTLNAQTTHELRSNLMARFSNSYTFRNYSGDSLSSDQTVWNTGAGLTWDLNRYLALTGDVSYEKTDQDSSPSSSVTKLGVGLTLRR
ncbi:outer membrane beta-barrel protein [Pararhizobium arenae]|uniref:outer membrane beta-barrel protein n=1 Tax=Pararhizobium arenae TaxID=1856850 RepID=UPI000ACEB446|nr:outer membrane beta-barrel protein [Pararhizobium arenae]